MRDGELLMAEAEGKRISKRRRGGAMTTLTESFEGKPFLAPNDLFVDSKGGIYFTDPGPRPVVPGRPTFVFYLAPGAKEPILLDGQVARPNGLTLTRDGKTLIVDDTIGPAVFAYEVQPDGTAKTKRTFAQLRDIPEGKTSPPDALALTTAGRLYIPTLPGVQVFDAGGQYLGTIKWPRPSAHATLAGPAKRSLYITP